MTHATFVISLDFELFWGVSDTRTIANYGRNVLGEWQAVPQMLALMRHHHVKATWATVGAIMCRDYAQWRALRPTLKPGDPRPTGYSYCEDELVKQHARLFFARPLVERILDTEGQELATHTYSHFYCREPGATPAGFAADLQRARDVATEMGAGFRSIVFPRNQIEPAFLAVLPAAGIAVYRGNPSHWLYRNGDAVPGGIAGRVARFADAFVPLSGPACHHAQADGGLVNLPASMFLYPWSPLSGAFSALRLRRIKEGMSEAARTGTVFHLWWHPHNFGTNLEQNLAMLGEILWHYRCLADKFGMRSQCMGDFAAGDVPPLVHPAPQAGLAPPRVAVCQRRVS